MLMSEYIGLKGLSELTVEEKHTAAAVASGTLPVFATPWLVALMESAAVQALAPKMAEGQSSVGARIDVRHTAATPLHMRVYAEAKVVHAEGRTVELTIEAFDEKGPVGTAEHTRVLIDTERFMKRVNEKRK